MNLSNKSLRGIVAINDSLDLAYEQINLQSQVSHWLPSALVEITGFHPTIVFSTRSSSTLF